MIGSETPRYYEADGNRQYPSVTTIQSVLNKPALIPWAINMAIEHGVSSLTPRQKYTPTEIRKVLKAAKWAYKDVSTQACDTGTTTHGLIEQHLRGEEVQLPEASPIFADIARSYVGFTRWFNDERLTLEDVVDVETRIVGVGYAGRTDAVIMLHGVKTLVDFKTSKGFYETYPMQLAAYVQAYNQTIPNEEDRIQACGVLRLNKHEPTYEYKDYTDQFHKSLAEFMALAIFWSIHRDEAYDVAIEQCGLIHGVLHDLQRNKPTTSEGESDE